MTRVEDRDKSDREPSREKPSAAQQGEEHRKPFANNVDYAEQHAAIVRRFGRYPHRNAILGRETTAEEEAFLKEPGSSF